MSGEDDMSKWFRSEDDVSRPELDHGGGEAEAGAGAEGVPPHWPL